MITIGYTYYQNKKLFERVRDYYSQMKNDDVKFIIVDDGSQENPLSVNDLNSNWRLLTVTEDIGWNNEGSRNLIMKEAETDWVLLIDLDHVLMPPVFYNLNTITNLDKEKAWFCERYLHVHSDGKFSPRPPHKTISANSFAIHKDLFWFHNGYDETFQGLYGYDATLVKAITPGKYAESRYRCGIEVFDVGGGGSTWTREEKNISQDKCRTMRSSSPLIQERIRFPWIDKGYGKREEVAQEPQEK